MTPRKTPRPVGKEVEYMAAVPKNPAGVPAKGVLFKSSLHGEEMLFIVQTEYNGKLLRKPCVVHALTGYIIYNADMFELTKTPQANCRTLVQRGEIAIRRIELMNTKDRVLAVISSVPVINRHLYSEEAAHV